jgi:hypothetical protein
MVFAQRFLVDPSDICKVHANTIFRKQTENLMWPYEKYLLESLRKCPSNTTDSTYQNTLQVAGCPVMFEGWIPMAFWRVVQLHK